MERVAELVRHAMAEILARGEIGEGALNGRPVTVTAVRMSPDLRVATVSVMSLGDRESAAIVQALESHKKQLRALVARKVSLKFVPDLRFSLDTAFAAQAHIDALLKSPEVARDLGPAVKSSKEDER